MWMPAAEENRNSAGRHATHTIFFALGNTRNGYPDDERAVSRYLLVVVDLDSKFFFAYPSPAKAAFGVTRKILEPVLACRMPSLITNDA